MLPDNSGPPVISRRGLTIAAATVAVIGVVIVVAGITTRKIADAKLQEWTEAQAVPVVAVAPPDTRGKTAAFSLPGRLEAYTQAQIYARVSGYVKDWKADIGTAVKAGDLLAEIDAPDLDQQIMQAEANLASAKANSALSDLTLKRGQSLITTLAISQQDLDQRAADASNKQGLVRAAQANLDRLRVLEQYKRIVAPFDGLVTARTTDIGALINAGAGGGPPLFVVSRINKLRVFVSVPQTYVPDIPIGTKASLTVPEYPGRTFPATVEASAQAVEIASGTTRIQLVVGNARNELMTGDFTQVTFDLPHPQIAIDVPASALIFNQNGLHVAVVGSNGRINLKEITIARDLGNEVEVASGITADDRVVINPPDGIATGDKVRIAGAPGIPGQPETAEAK
ncbi:MAG: efflux RND transporter periplasmic adaptor subunit [Hyphomicrobiales bacterium]|nr:efflux RND transporter periplasmic adaptor subunit [Hyphomicrobiales bacterium]MDE2283981.1 efflux RND transporter periplasmic adaptor subunit [Hyphomicrobiales bacterium]